MAEKFTWNFSSIAPECLYSEYKKVRIGIEGVYAYGTGYLVDKTAFERELYPELAIAGYLVDFSRTYGVCDELRLVSKDSLRNNICLNPEALFNVYMHPAEFTGYMKDSDVEEITEILKKNSFVKNVEVTYKKPVLNLTNNEYKKVIRDNFTNICKYIAHLKELKYSDIDAAFEFARNYGNITLEDPKTVLSSDTVEVRYITEFLDNLKSLEIDIRDLNKLSKEKSISAKKDNEKSKLKIPDIIKDLFLDSKIIIRINNEREHQIFLENFKNDIKLISLSYKPEYTYYLADNGSNNLVRYSTAILEPDLDDKLELYLEEIYEISQIKKIPDAIIDMFINKEIAIQVNSKLEQYMLFLTLYGSGKFTIILKDYPFYHKEYPFYCINTVNKVDDKQYMEDIAEIDNIKQFVEFNDWDNIQGITEDKQYI